MMSSFLRGLLKGLERVSQEHAERQRRQQTEGRLAAPRPKRDAPNKKFVFQNPASTGCGKC